MMDRYSETHPAAHKPEDLMDFFKFSGFILDLGTGSGRHGRYLEEKGFDVVGLDISLEQLKKATLKNLVNSSGDKLPFKSKLFDCVLCSEVLEHLFQPEDCLKEIKRVLKNGGLACITTPCCNLPLRKIAIPVYRKLAGIKLEPYEHIHVFDSRNLLNMISNYFKIEEVRYLDFTAVLKWRFACGYSVDNFLSGLCKKLPFLKYFAGSVFIKARTI